MSKKKNEEIEEIINEEIEEIEEVIDNNDELSKKDEEIKSLNDKYLRLLAEYDNFKKRTIKEKELIYVNTAGETIGKLLGVLDNLQRAVESIEDKESTVYTGLEMIFKQTLETFESLGVKETNCVGEAFNPELHNAVMHIDDENVAENIVVEEFQKGYTYKDKVLRYSMVKVAN